MSNISFRCRRKKNAHSIQKYVLVWIIPDMPIFYLKHWTDSNSIKSRLSTHADQHSWNFSWLFHIYFWRLFYKISYGTVVALPRWLLYSSLSNIKAYGNNDEKEKVVTYCYCSHVSNMSSDKRIDGRIDRRADTNIILCSMLEHRQRNIFFLKI